MDVKKKCFSNVPFFIVCLALSFFINYVQSGCSRRSPVIFNFGDSNSDTGGYVAGLGLRMGFPEGRAFFHHPTGRVADGRLVFAPPFYGRGTAGESLNTSYLSPYLESLGANFTNGANFAIAGASTLPEFVQFNLNVQIRQFIRFQDRSLYLSTKGYKNLVGVDGFKNALYMIDIGQNDLAAAFRGLSYAQVVDKVPSFISEIKDAMCNIYEQGGKNFWVHNTGPLGCLPQELATTVNATSNLDEYGCLQLLNEGAKLFNTQLNSLCEELRVSMGNVTIVYVDLYAIKYHLITNSALYGFDNPLMACCGYGGAPYNYNPKTLCGQTGCDVCEDGSKYISWDGVHYSEYANAILASKILSNNYSTPLINFDYFCNS